MLKRYWLIICLSLTVSLPNPPGCSAAPNVTSGAAPSAQQGLAELKQLGDQIERVIVDWSLIAVQAIHHGVDQGAGKVEHWLQQVNHGRA